MKLSITIPTSLKDITLRQYKHFLNIQKEDKGDKFYDAKMIEIFCNMPLSNVILLKLSDSQEIIKLLNDIFDTKPALVQRFKLNKIEYGFHPQLDDLTLGEYIDLDTFIGDWNQIEKAMNVLYRPIIAKLKDKYTIKDYEVGTEQDLLDMPMDAVMSSIFFLWNLGLELSTIMMNSLDNQENEALIKHLSLTQNGDGINQFMHSLKGTLEDLKISLN
tara:strand:- start:736 stop:1386 length:651 start_codon:yes stop_codon:yes gene_type:complete